MTPQTPFLIGSARADTRPDAPEREVRALTSVEIAQPVGERYQYSNANYIVFGLVIETIAGQSFSEYVHEHILRPIGTTNSFTSQDLARTNGLATGHRYWFGVRVSADLPRARAVLPAGYVIASAEDMARYLGMLQNGGRVGDTQMLSQAGIAELFRPVRTAPGYSRA